MKRKIGLFGGSFNPIHNSHIKIAREVLAQNFVDEVWIIPCFSHNFGKELSSFEDRKEMIRLAFDDSEKIKICEIEKELGGISKTYDTVIELKNKYNHDFLWICGSDCVADFHKWHNAEKLSEEIEFIVYDRDSFEIKKDSIMKIAFILNATTDNISSSEIRGRIKNGKDVSNLLPRGTLDYIKKEDLYK